MTIYYVEDEANIRELTLYALRQAGHNARGFANAEEFYAACSQELPNLVLLDIMLPGVSGLEILSQLRKQPAMREIPIMMLTAKGTEFDKVTGLDAGADDYLAKPFGMMELVSRINALLRRSGEAHTSSVLRTITCGPICIDLRTHEASVNTIPLRLTLKEFDLLQLFAENPGRVFTREQIMEDVWGMSFVGETRTVDVHVQKLRQKLGDAYVPAAGMIHTIRGVGYCIKEQ